jgi:aerobic carbon-monoxide dehydrogenase medium subunit
MKAAPFAYIAPRTVEDALAALRRYDGAARVLAGGQSLVPMLAMRLMRPAAVVDINGLAPDLGRIVVRGEATLVGALVRYSELETSATVAERLPLVATVVRAVGDRQVRNRGTVGGALAQSDPTGEIALACLALEATVVAQGPDGERAIPIEDFFTGAYANVLEPDELVVGVRFPWRASRFRFFEHTRKHNDFAVVSIAIVVTPHGTTRIALGGVDDRPVLVEGASESALAAIDPPNDVRASAEYRRHLVAVHLRRLLADLEADG